jgi:bacterioferritin (cytochrome b1)
MRELRTALAFPLEPEGRAPPRGSALDPRAFAGELAAETVRALARLAERLRAPLWGEATVADLLGAALRDEVEAAEIAAIWMAGEPDLELKLGLARQAGDEARHYRAIAERMRELGGDPAAAEARWRGPSPTFRHLKGLQVPAERLAAASVREGIARVRNAAFAAACEARGDVETARLYREVIAPDEARHQEFVEAMLARFALTAEDQERARRAAARVLQLVEDPNDSARPRPPASRGPTS